jgi:K+-sensing histidine kinase KdpD
VELGLRRAGERWLCEVRDEGPGVPEKDRPALFRKLKKGSNLPTSGEESSGLGLYSATKLVEAMHGSIEFEPGRTTGSVFRVSLAVAVAKP